MSSAAPIILRLVADGKPCWHRVRIHPTKRPLLVRLKAGEPIDVAQLGEVLESGWGEPPPEAVDYTQIDA